MVHLTSPIDLAISNLSKQLTKCEIVISEVPLRLLGSSRHIYNGRKTVSIRSSHTKVPLWCIEEKSNPQPPISVSTHPLRERRFEEGHVSKDHFL